MGNTSTLWYRKPIVILAVVLLVVGGGVAAWWFLRAPAQDYVQFVNGFDFPVTATVKSASGKEQVILIPAHGRVGADFDGKHTVKVTRQGGVFVSEEKVNFGARDKRKERCQMFFNVLGSAAIIAEEVHYGIGSLPYATLTSGKTMVKLCSSWGFETKEPPEAINLEGGGMAATLTWMHYIGDGSWATSVRELVQRLPDTTNPYLRKNLARRIIRAVITHDPDNEHLPVLAALYKTHGLDFPEDYRQLAKIIASKKKGEKALKAGRWSVGGKKDVSLLAGAEETINYLARDVRPLLILRCRKNQPVVIVQTAGPSAMEIHGTSASRNTVSVAFDDANPEKILAIQGASHEVLVLPRPVHLFEKLLESDKLLFRHTKLGDEPQAITFDVRGLDQVIWKLEEPCRWTE